MARPAPAPGDDAFKRAEKRYRRQKSRSLDDPLFKDALDCARLVRPPQPPPAGATLTPPRAPALTVHRL